MKNFLFILFILLAPVLSFAGTYYVDDNGAASWTNCEENGGIPGPKSGVAACSLATANASADAGDTIYLRGGTYDISYSNRIIAPDNSGSNGNQITFAKYASESVILDGSNITGSIIYLSSKSYITIDGFITTNPPADMTVYTGGGGSSYSTGLIIQNCTFNTKGIYARSVQNFQVLNNDFVNITYYGINFSGSQNYPSTQTRVEGNSFTGTFSGTDVITYHEDSSYYPNGNSHLVKNNTVVMSGGENCLDFTSGHYIVADGNNCTGTSGQLVLIGSGSSSKTNELTFVRVINHKSYNTGSTSEHLHMGGELDDGMGYIQILRSEFYGTGEHNIRSQAEELTTLRVFHNILDGREIGDNLNLQIQDYLTDVKVKNNIFVISSGDYAQYYQDINDCGASDYNLYYHLSGTGYDIWSNGPSNLSEVYASYGHEQHGIDDNPDFTNITTRDYTLQTGSPAINTGGWLTTITSNSGSGTSFVVDDPYWFYDGWNIGAGESWAETGDVIKTENGQSATITAINYGTKTITVTSSISWTKDEGIALSYSGTKPDIGAYEYIGGDSTATTASGVTGGGSL